MKNPCAINKNMLNTGIEHSLDLASFMIALPFAYSSALPNESAVIDKCFNNNSQLAAIGSHLVRHKSNLHCIDDIDDSDIRTALQFHVWASLDHNYPTLNYFNETTELKKYVMSVISDIDFDEVRKLIAAYRESEACNVDTVMDTIDTIAIVDSIEKEFKEFALWLASLDISAMVKRIMTDNLTAIQIRDHINNVWDNKKYRDIKRAYKTKDTFIAAVYNALHNEPEDDEWM